MTPPIRRRSLAEIADETLAPDPYKTTNTPRIGSESTGTRATIRNATPEQVAANKRANKDFATGLAISGLQGATMGNFDEVGGAIGSGFGMVGDYKKTRDAIRARDAAFTKDNPTAAFLANLAGGVATGGALGAAAKGTGALARTLTTTGLAPKASAGASALSRVGQGVKTGLVAGGITGVGMAPEMDDALMYGAGGAIGGGVLGGAFAGGAELLRGGRNMVAAGIRGREAKGLRGVAANAVEADSPEKMAVWRILNRLPEGKGASAFDDAAKAESPLLSAAEVIDRMDPEQRLQGTQALRISRNTGRERDMLDKSLRDRAAEEPARWYRTAAQESGVPRPEAPDRFAERVRQMALTESEPFYGQVDNLPPVEEPIIADVVDKLRMTPNYGSRVMKEAQARAGVRGEQLPTEFRRPAQPPKPSMILGPDGAPASMTPGVPEGPLALPVRNVLDLRRGFDETLRSMQEAGENPEVAARLFEMRTELDNIAKRFDPVKQGDEIYAKRMGQIESFRAGDGLNRAATPEEVAARAAEAASPEDFQRGAASRLLTDAANVADDEGGRLGNPVAKVFGSETARARARAGFPDDASYERAHAEAMQIVQRLLTKQRVSSNSTTAANLAEMADEFMVDPQAFVSAIGSPKTALATLLASQGKRVAQGMTSAQATQMGRLLGAGLPGQQPVSATSEMLKRWEPLIVKQLQRQMMARGAATRAGLAAASVSGR